MAESRRQWVLHTADLHLLSPGDRGCHSLEAVVDLAIKTGVGLVIVAGDFFESTRADEDLVSFAVEQLRRLSVPAVILPGNHDCLIPDSVYHRVELWQAATNVQIFRAPQGETFTFPDLGVSVWGKPLISYGGDMRPLSGMPQPEEDGQWHIAVAHGYYDDTESHSQRSFPISQEEIVTSHQDYIALGHCPVFRCLCDEPVKAYYCDSPSGSFPENTVNIVDLVEGAGVQVTRCSL